MRISNEVHLQEPWLIHTLVGDFTLVDVWAMPAISGDEEAFGRVIEMAAQFNPANAESAPTRFLWWVRDRLGERFNLGRISTTASAEDRLPIPGTREYSLADRLPDNQRGSANGVRFEHLPFVPLYRAKREFAAEISNQTVHGVMHLAWAHRDGDSHEARMAVYVKPRGRFGRAYMAFIKPFRYLIVYPALERQLEHIWMDHQAVQ